jgi:hypothetical protein
MNIKAKFPISTGDGKGGKIIIPKGATGSIISTSNSIKIKAQFPNLDYKIDGWYYICSFPGFIDEILCDRNQVEF